jgi:sigma-E factor negative regulatory protein RseC
MENCDIAQIAIIKKVYEKENIVLASIKPHNACNGCNACSMFSGIDEKTEININLRCKIKLTVGDIVEYSNSESGELTASLLLFLLPILSFMGGMFLSYNVSPKEIYMFFSGLFFMSITFMILKYLEKNEIFTWMLPEVIKVVENGKVRVEN